MTSNAAPRVALTPEEVEMIYAAFERVSGYEARTPEGKRRIVEPLYRAVIAARIAAAHDLRCAVCHQLKAHSYHEQPGRGQGWEPPQHPFYAATLDRERAEPSDSPRLREALREALHDCEPIYEGEPGHPPLVTYKVPEELALRIDDALAIDAYHIGSPAGYAAYPLDQPHPTREWTAISHDVGCCASRGCHQVCSHLCGTDLHTCDGTPHPVPEVRHDYIWNGDHDGDGPRRPLPAIPVAEE